MYRSLRYISNTFKAQGNLHYFSPSSPQFPDAPLAKLPHQKSNVGACGRVFHYGGIGWTHPHTPFPPFSNNPPHFQTLNVVMLITAAKSRSARGAYPQPAVMVSCLTIHACLPCLPSGRVIHCVSGFTEVGSWCYSRKWVWSSRTKLCQWEVDDLGRWEG